MEPVEEGADRSVLGEETGADFAACGECGEALDNTVGSGDRMGPWIFECTVRVLRWGVNYGQDASGQGRQDLLGSDKTLDSPAGV